MYTAKVAHVLVKKWDDTVLLNASRYRKKSEYIFTEHSKERSLSFSPRFVKLNVIQLLIG